jgi:hypothetical protein
MQFVTFVNGNEEGARSMDRVKMTRVISFRVTENEWFDIERAAAKSSDTANDWCRELVLETIRTPEGMTPNQRLFFSQICHTHYLVWVGFQLLAEDKLSGENYDHYREYAKTHVDAIVNDALQNFRSKNVK